MGKWNLDALYKGFEGEFEKDTRLLEIEVENINNLVKRIDEYKGSDLVKYYLNIEERIEVLANSLFGYASLVSSTDVTNSEALLAMSKLMNILNGMTESDVIFSRYLASLNLDDLAKESELIKKYLFRLYKKQNAAKHLLTEKEEILYAKMSELASGSWDQLHGLVTANMPVHYKGEVITLTEVRNKAYDSDKTVRQEAYNAELKAYDLMADQVALALSNIKREVNLMVELRGYESALEKTLISSNMRKETLDAMMEAMNEYKVYFAEYLKAKAKYLGHEGSLPFYDLFAPVGKLDKTYSLAEAKKLVLESFHSFSDKLGDFAKRAFDNEWIDYFPRKGKVGGAFCSNQPQIGQSRILTNYTESLSDILTLAHELGHGYHGDVISENAPLHWDYPMPLAETASIFCETIMNNHLLSSINDDSERLTVLENSLQGDTQVIIDILSRFIFEDNLIKKSQGPVSKEEMKEMMVNAQKEAYLDGLDSNYLHPFMWLCKGHYYSAGLNYYNFPYAFGLLFGKGLYAKYLTDKESFTVNYDKLLKTTTFASVEDCAKTMDIDVTSKEFWVSSLEVIKKDIDEVIKLLNNSSK